MNFGHYAIVKRPYLYESSVIWYKPSDVYKAFKLFLKASLKPQFEASPTFQLIKSVKIY